MRHGSTCSLNDLIFETWEHVWFKWYLFLRKGSTWGSKNKSGTRKAGIRYARTAFDIAFIFVCTKQELQSISWARMTKFNIGFFLLSFFFFIDSSIKWWSKKMIHQTQIHINFDHVLMAILLGRQMSQLLPFFASLTLSLFLQNRRQKNFSKLLHLMVKILNWN